MYTHAMPFHYGDITLAAYVALYGIYIIWHLTEYYGSDFHGRVARAPVSLLATARIQAQSSSCWRAKIFEGGVLRVVPCRKLRPVVPEKRLVHCRRKIIHMLSLCLQACMQREIKVTIKPCAWCLIR
jgi:hypothetical protein